MDLREEQWELVKPFVQWSAKRRTDGRGRPFRDARPVLNGVLWILRTGAQWHDLPERYGPYQTCHRRFQKWPRRHLGRDAVGIGRRPSGTRQVGPGRDVCRCLLRGGKKGGDGVGPTKHGKGSKILAITDRHGLPIAVRVTSASPHECQLVEDTLRERFVGPVPERMIGDRGYDSDPLDQRLRQQQGVELIAPHRYNRSKPRTQDGRGLGDTCDAGRWKDCLPG